MHLKLQRHSKLWNIYWQICITIKLITIIVNSCKHMRHNNTHFKITTHERWELWFFLLITENTNTNFYYIKLVKRWIHKEYCQLIYIIWAFNVCRVRDNEMLLTALFIAAVYWSLHIALRIDFKYIRLISYACYNLGKLSNIISLYWVL